MMYSWMEGWSSLILFMYFIHTSLVPAWRACQSNSSSSVPCKHSSLHPSFFIWTHLLVLRQLRTNMSEDMLRTYHMSVVGDVEFLHDRCDGHVDGCTSITIEYKVFTFAKSCLHQGSEKKCVIHSGFFTTEVTGNGLDVMISIHEHGRQQLAVVTLLQND